MSPIITLAPKGDARGWLIALEQTIVGFPIRRVYYIYGTLLNARRGMHAHRKLRQLAVCVAGSCRITFDDGFVKQDYLLDSPAKAIRIDPMMWHEMDAFSPDCVLMVLASGSYDEADYIRSYAEFTSLIATRSKGRPRRQREA